MLRWITMLPKIIDGTASRSGLFNPQKQTSLILENGKAREQDCTLQIKPRSTSHWTDWDIAVSSIRIVLSEHGRRADVFKMRTGCRGAMNGGGRAVGTAGNTWAQVSCRRTHPLPANETVGGLQGLCGWSGGGSARPPLPLTLPTRQSLEWMVLLWCCNCEGSNYYFVAKPHFRPH